MAVPAGPPVVLTREREDNAPLAAALNARGVPVVEVPCLETRFVSPETWPPVGDAVIFTSRRGVEGFTRQPGARAFLQQHALVAAVGPTTAAALEGAGVHVAVVADPPRGEVLARTLLDPSAPRLRPGSVVTVVRGNLRASGLDEALGAAGVVLHSLVVYENVEPPVPALAPREVAAVMVASPSAGRRLLAANPWLREATFLAVGATTRESLIGHGVTRVRDAGATLDSWITASCAAHRDATTGP